jgi:muramoyltetrapeptide carboxypeptidase
LEEFHRLYFMKEVEALWAVRGGYGCMHLLPNIDYKKISKNPKYIFGYSDLIALFLALQKNSGLQCFHAPMPFEFFKNENLELSCSHLDSLKLLLSLESPYKRFSTSNLIKAFPVLEDKLKESASLNKNKKLLGGNLSILVSLIGSSFLPDFSDSILFLEDCNEPKYKIDRMLHQLIYSGLIENVSEIWIGSPQECNFTYKALEGFILKKRINLIRDLPFGHSPENYVLPLG